MVLGFETAGAVQCFIPPAVPSMATPLCLHGGMGERWWRVGGAVYLLDAVKAGARHAAHCAGVERSSRARTQKLAAVAKRDPRPCGPPCA